MIVNTLGKLTIARKAGTEPVHAGGEALEHTLLGFWRWSTSDLVNNATRGVLAEYLVACALGLEAGLRVEWDAYDLRMTDGTTVEIKSAAYLQSWDQERESAIGFDIRPTRGWDAATNTTASAPRRQADLYVFALLHHRDKATVDPLDVTQWTFHVLPTDILDARRPGQRRLSLSTLRTLDPAIVAFDGLAAAIEVAGRARRASDPNDPLPAVAEQQMEDADGAA